MIERLVLPHRASASAEPIDRTRGRSLQAFHHAGKRRDNSVAFEEEGKNPMNMVGHHYGDASEMLDAFHGEYVPQHNRPGSGWKPSEIARPKGDERRPVIADDVRKISAMEELIQHPIENPSDAALGPETLRGTGADVSEELLGRELGYVT